ncbi:hypothetical protein JW756_05860 [Candidatus Woesearchaeota archaeon]|nr:hypothetical protein [Candidatus Woesearchaeota archaeon]
MRKISQKFRLLLLFLGLFIYTSLIIHFSYGEPAGADVSYISTSNYSGNPGSRADPGGNIITMTIDTTQQDSAWKAYVGNITGKLVLRNADSWSIYEWPLASATLSGFIFASRNDSVSWSSILCANDSTILAEQEFLGMSSTASDNINNTFNWTDHDAMALSGLSDIAADSCSATATFVNGTSQPADDTAFFQELLLYDNTDLNFVYGTFIEQNLYGYDSNNSINSTRDFQIIVAENASSTGTTYYFYADLQ